MSVFFCPVTICLNIESEEIILHTDSCHKYLKEEVIILITSLKVFNVYACFYFCLLLVPRNSYINDWNTEYEKCQIMHTRYWISCYYLVKYMLKSGMGCFSWFFYLIYTDVSKKRLSFTLRIFLKKKEKEKENKIKVENEQI